jgi:hypothetical protein
MKQGAGITVGITMVLNALVVSGFGRTIADFNRTIPGFSRTVSGFFGGAAASHSAQARAGTERVPQFDNERAIAWKSIIPPHSESTLHRHDRFRALIAISGGDLKTVTGDGEANVTHLERGKAYWQGPMAPGVMHKDVNDTDETIEVVVVEMK